jgi:hypothetical protein
VLETYNAKWRGELGDYVKRLPGGDQEGRTRGRIEMIFKYPLVPRIAGRAFLYGEKPSVATFLRSFQLPVGSRGRRPGFPGSSC